MKRFFLFVLIITKVTALRAAEPAKKAELSVQKTALLNYYYENYDVLEPITHRLPSLAGKNTYFYYYNPTTQKYIGISDAQENNGRHITYSGHYKYCQLQLPDPLYIQANPTEELFLYRPQETDDQHYLLCPNQSKELIFSEVAPATCFSQSNTQEYYTTEGNTQVVHKSIQNEKYSSLFIQNYKDNRTIRSMSCNKITTINSDVIIVLTEPNTVYWNIRDVTAPERFLEDKFAVKLTEVNIKYVSSVALQEPEQIVYCLIGYDKKSNNITYKLRNYSINSDQPFTVAIQYPKRPLRTFLTKDNQFLCITDHRSFFHIHHLASHFTYTRKMPTQQKFIFSAGNLYQIVQQQDGKSILLPFINDTIRKLLASPKLITTTVGSKTIDAAVKQKIFAKILNTDRLTFWMREHRTGLKRTCFCLIAALLITFSWHYYNR